MFLSLIRSRRSIRKYEPRSVEPEKVALLVEAALRSPSSMGNHPWEFIIVSEPEALESLSRAKPHGAGFLKEAPLAVVVLADPLKSSVWIEDAAIATTFIHLAAHSLGLGSCWIQIRDRMHGEGISAEEHVRKVLSIPAHLKVEAMVAIGYPSEELPGWPDGALPYGKVFVGTYARPYRA